MFPQLILFLGACVTSTLAQAEVPYLNEKILPLCFERPTYSDGVLYVNGQIDPLANSIENFISLSEKFELANTDMKLEDELFILLKNYTAENVIYLQGSKLLDKWRVASSKMSVFENMWEPDKTKKLPNHIDPFEENEKCSLFFMLSHTVNTTHRPNVDPKQQSYAPSPEDVHHAVTGTQISREQGVVSVNRSNAHAIALGRVLLGLYVGLKNGNKKSFDSYELNPDITLNEIQGVDPLYLVTLADQLIISQFQAEEPSQSQKFGLGENGRWRTVQPLSAVRPKDNDFPTCPTEYVLPLDSTSVFTFSSVRGGTDGLILGDVIKDIYNRQPSVRLSQILRMYYGRSGLYERSSAPPSNEIISFCQRINKMAPKEKLLKDQMRVFLALVYELKDFDDVLKKAVALYGQNKKSINMPDKDMESYCDLLKESKGIPKCETAVDVVFVLDTTSDLETQQEIIGNLANNLNMAYGGSTLTVFSDQRNSTDGLGLLTVISNTSSSACAACSATQFQIDSTPQADKETVIDSVSKVLRNVEDEEKILNGARGKVVIFFNFLEEETVTFQLQRALRNLYTKHVDVQFFAVGNSKDVLRTYTRGQVQNVLSVLGYVPREVADTLALKICEVPSKLQYDDCKDRRNEQSAVYEGLISSNSIQRWAMYPKYFFKSLTPKMFFQSENSQIQVCHSRAYSLAENQEEHCQKTGPTGGKLEFNATNPCRSFSDRNCAPWYFTVTLVENSDTGSVPEREYYCQDTNSVRCKTLDQVKFRVFHEGIRCSSCAGLFSMPGLLLACFAVYLLTRHMNSNI